VCVSRCSRCVPVYVLCMCVCVLHVWCVCVSQVVYVWFLSMFLSRCGSVVVCVLCGVCPGSRWWFPGSVRVCSCVCLCSMCGFRCVCVSVQCVVAVVVVTPLSSEVLTRQPPLPPIVLPLPLVRTTPERLPPPLHHFTHFHTTTLRLLPLTSLITLHSLLPLHSLSYYLLPLTFTSLLFTHLHSYSLYSSHFVSPQNSVLTYHAL
jgi:hypothetical protein